MTKDEPFTTSDNVTEGGIPLTAIDRELLAMKDEDFHRVTWDELRHIILVTNALEQLKRLPSDLRRYVTWSASIKSQYGSITSYVIQERLHWTPSDPNVAIPTFTHHNPIPFADSRDYQILLNDWPYGLEDGITHIVVWTKALIDVDPEKGDVTAESRGLIEGFVVRVFSRRLDGVLGEGKGRERVLWFKNWVSLQSVRGVDHVHVLVKDAPGEVLEEWTRRTSEPLTW
ncbi:hypothetical protein KVT40_001522 [Elsinoe batatas]|uniref:N-acetylglucosamine-induced protein 1 n=1 Tax=Elsinoe batatas TaxID=2601811 RepID=A0A8K0LCX0_9PEZI|nr:hypothetical protein KVT40_001522 [Elsinoe batatas]